MLKLFSNTSFENDLANFPSELYICDIFFQSSAKILNK